VNPESVIGSKRFAVIKHIDSSIENNQ